MNADWHIFKGRSKEQTEQAYTPRKEAIDSLPEPPKWRDFGKQHSTDETERVTKKQRRGATFFPSEDEKAMVNAALYLRRPLLVTGRPGTGKTSLAYAVAYELDLGEVLYWPITTRMTLKDGLYSYDAIGRIQDFQLRGKKEDRIGDYIRLGPLGTAFLENEDKKPRVLLVDEIDKSDIDLPNDLLHIFEDGEFSIPELERFAGDDVYVKTAYRDEAESTFEEKVKIIKGRVRCQQFPFVILTSNGEREFPPAFLRRCLRLDIQQPTEERLRQIVEAQLDPSLLEKANDLIVEFLKRRDIQGEFLTTDQLLHAVYLITKEKAPDSIKEKLFQNLDK